MSKLLQLFILIPFLGFLFSLFAPRKREAVISGIAIGTVSIHLLGMLCFVMFWLLNGHPVLNIKHMVIFKTGNIEIFINYYFDKITLVYALVGGTLAFLVTVFSRYYLHRDEGFRRFFNKLLLFYLGYNIIIFSGNFETLFVGWELIGISSFLLIAFYRDRYLPVRNGLKVISFYRISDICLMIAMWLSHHLWHENISFWKLNDIGLVQEHIRHEYVLSLTMAIMIVTAAAIKSAQFPFSSWLPRAMEGPTTSSAIFYGSLAVHIGVFILLRTFPFWENLLTVKIFIILIGVVTSLAATSIARVQATVKTQIAYSSIAQIGLIFIEVALGFHNLALVHFTANAFLRTYQLLVSPSVLSYLIHDMMFSFKPKARGHSRSFLTWLKNSLYVLSLKEWNLDFVLYKFLWNPFKQMGKRLDFLKNKSTIILLGLFFLGGIYLYFFKEIVPGSIYGFLPYMYSLIALSLVLKAFAERGNARTTWLLVLAGKFFIALSIALNEQFEFDQIILFLSGAIVAGLVGYTCLNKIKAIDNDIELNHFHGYVYEKPGIALVFLLSCLGMLGFPITPGFIGVDLMFTHIRKDQFVLIFLTSLNFIFIELSVLRIYIRIFLGQHKKTHHPIAYRSS